ncbi:hypothetical protein DC522_24295 [Microvirga sp. KLBC 81]|uniref:hypothetical protein n=1 Tax=Microvirga sp. KLBC 81 TaxID=1862707 RepID=UPI000D519006|nr:hypothetical protein [Microvirga sp. KLBC 81]PVE21838.1 hypothetical protein DC522_24295 [Microvirga sp. KLBC 81]
MALATSDDWPAGQLIVVLHAWRGDGFWQDIQVEVQQRIGADLRTMDTDLLQQPLSPNEIRRIVLEVII